MCGNGAEEIFGTRVGANGLVGEEQPVHSMGLVLREIRILAQRSTSPSKGLFYFTLIITHVQIIYCICCKYFLFIFPLQVKIKPCEGIQNMRLSLFKLSWLQTSTSNNCSRGQLLPSRKWSEDIGNPLAYRNAIIISKSCLHHLRNSQNVANMLEHPITGFLNCLTVPSDSLYKICRGIPRTSEIILISSH